MPVSSSGLGWKRFARDRKAKVAAMPAGVEIGFFGPSAVDAMVNEFGIPNKVAERPAFRNAIRDALDELRRETARRLLRGKGGITEADALAIGQVLADRLRASVEELDQPPNRPWKAQSDPLVFTGRMLKSIGVRIIR